MINPYSEKQVSEGVISYGVSSYEYDLRAADEFKIFTNVNRTTVDPNHFDERSFVTVNVGRDRPVEFVCAGAVGRVLQDSARCADHLRGQAIYARYGIIVNVTPFAPEWEGFVTLEISNTTPLPAKIYAKRMPLPNSLLPVGRGLRDQLQGSQEKVPGGRKGLCRRSCRAAFSTQPSALSFQFDCGALVGSAVDECPANHSKTLRSNSCGAALCAPV